MDLNGKIALAVTINEHIISHLSGIWPGFTPVPFILFDEQHQVAVGDQWPERYIKKQENIWVAEGADPLLMGSTSIMYHDRLTAIWDTRTWPDEPDAVEAAAGIAHEMFHSFQLAALSDIPFANELLLPSYPHSMQSVALVIEENKWLAETLITQNPTLILEYLNKITELRKLRKVEIGAEYLEYDQCVESMEGTAAYVEICMKAALRNEAPPKSAASYLPILMQKENMLARYRHRCYTAGLILCLATDILFPEWKSEWPPTKLPLLEWLKDKLALSETEVIIDDTTLQAAAEILSIYQKDKEQRINEFLAQPLMSFEGDIELMLFDPMNQVCVGNRCLHQHGKIRLGKNEYLLEQPFLEDFDGTILNAKRILIPHTISHLITE